MRQLFRAVLMATLVIWLGSAASADPPPAGAGENLITMNFQDVDISVLAKFISQITGKNFVLDESVRGKVSIVSPTKVTPEQAYSIFKSVLQLKGFTTVAAGPVIKIIPSRDSRGSAALTTSQQPAVSGTDAFVTRMIKLRNVDASSLVNVIQPMISRDGLVAAFPETNTLIVTDDAWNVQRLLGIIGSLDAQGIQQSVAVIPLKLAYADDLAPKIEQIMGERASGSSAYGRPGMGVVAPSAEAPSRAFKIVPDERTNSLVVLAGPLQMKEIKDLVDKLDIHSPAATSRVHVYYLRYAQALEMVSVLNSLLGGGGGGPGMLSPQTGRGSLGRGSGLGFGGMGTGGLGGGLGGGMGGLGGGMGGLGGGMGGFGGMGGGLGGMGGGGFGGGFGGGMGGGMGGRNRASGSLGGGEVAAAMATGGPGTEFEQPVRVTADPATNSLVVSASPQDYSTLQTIISQLDIPRRQVYVQAVIVEVSTNRMRELGVSFQGSANFGGNTLGVGHFDYGNLANALTNPLGATGLTFGLASGSMCTVNSALSAAASTTSGTTTATSVTVPCDIALITAIETDTHSNVLSAPTLLTTDNEEATIVVGQNVPFISSATATAAITGQIFQSVDRQNVGITLDIVPQITEGGYIKMDVYEEVSAVILSTVNNPLGPTTTIRSASTTVLVQNHRTTVIGGLLADEVDITNNGVPYLSNIPVLGNLFSDKQNSGQKTDLLVFLTPHVILNREDLRELSLDERQRFLQTLGRKEIHDMPLAQVREIFKPSFSVSVPPGAEFGTPNPQPDNGGGAGAAAGPSGVETGPAPMNTYEIGPSARRTAPSGPAAVAPTGVAVAPAGPLAGAPSAPSGAAASSSGVTSTSSSPGSVQAQAHKSGGTLDSVKGLFDLR
ncbi:MAG TPA: type II secretion system secretin GspD [Candidatus Binataceae bacterium]|jgi:general secretion pathway protein D|nr:type II secretion system secretin GspD [Candidatus Binataceae bacterium]